MSSKRQAVQEAEALLARHQPHVQYDVTGGLERHRGLIAHGAAAPAWSAQVPKPATSSLLTVQAKLLAIFLGSASVVVAVVWWSAQSTRHADAAQASRPRASAAASSDAETWPRASRPTTATRLDSAPIVTPLPTAVQQKPAEKAAADLEPTNVAQAPAPSRASHTAQQESSRRTRRLTARSAVRERQDADEEPTQDNGELLEIARAERLLDVDPAASLRIVHTCEHNHPDGLFIQERRYIEVMALIALGRASEAHPKARAFFLDYKDSAYRRRIENALRP